MPTVVTKPSGCRSAAAFINEAKGCAVERSYARSLTPSGLAAAVVRDFVG